MEHLFKGSRNISTICEGLYCSYKNVTTIETVDLEECKLKLLITSLRSRTFNNI
jgi:translation initiation factor 1 (eIF-1/SUI1)